MAIRRDRIGPRARAEGLVVKAVADELLVYDLREDRAHSLNRVAAAVWRRCDGQRDVAGLAAAVATELGTGIDRAVIEHALGQLARARLLADPGPASAAPGLGRREMLRRVGAVAAAVPVVTSIVAPRAAAAQSVSCLQENDACGEGIDASCCPSLLCCVLLGQTVGACCQV
jgi:hypothetical protein